MGVVEVEWRDVKGLTEVTVQEALLSIGSHPVYCFEIHSVCFEIHCLLRNPLCLLRDSLHLLLPRHFGHVIHPLQGITRNRRHMKWLDLYHSACPTTA